MKAMILAAGYGTRLGKLTKDIPKPMLDLCGWPILEHIIRNLARQDFNQIAINLHYKADMIKNYFGSGKRFGVDLVYSCEPKLLGTAGGIKKMGWFLGTDTFLVHYGDIVTNQDFRPMLQFYHECNALAVLLVHQYAHAHSSIEVDEWRITSFAERPAKRAEGSWDNSCVHFCDPQILGGIPAGVVCDLAKDVWPRFVSTGRLFAFPVSDYYCAIDSLGQLDEARKDMSC